MENSGQRLHVLIAEDYVDFQERLLNLLSPLPLTCVTATNGGTAIGFIKDHAQPIDLLITDLDMPVKNGWDVIAAFRTHRDPALPVIMQTGEARYSYVRRRAEELGIVLIDKMDVAARLPAAVSQALGLSLPG